MDPPVTTRCRHPLEVLHGVGDVGLFSIEARPLRSLERVLVIIEVLDGRARGLEIAADRDETVDFRTHAGAAEARPGIEIERKKFRGVLHVEFRRFRSDHRERIDNTISGQVEVSRG